MGGLSGASRPASGRPAKSIVKGSRVGRGAALKGPLLRPPAALDRCSVPGSDTCPRTRHFGATQCCRSGADKNGRVNPDVADVRLALIRQWELIAGVIKSLDLSAASRCTGWTNREVLAHLYVQPHLVARFIDTESTGETALGIVENLSGTNSFGELIDASARDGAALNKVDLNRPLNTVRARVLAADLDATISTLQGSISVSDYLVTRCVEAVVHGGDLNPSVPPDPGAQAIASQALLDTLFALAPELFAEAAALPVEQWIELATGRSRATGRLADVLPVMA